MLLTTEGKLFRRYVFSVQYHGSSFLGFSAQPNLEDRIVDGRTDLRGYKTVESRLSEALTDLVGGKQWRGMQVSSRTDRGVHALKNTLHVDVSQMDLCEDHSERLHRGVNYFLRRQLPWFIKEQESEGQSRNQRRRKRTFSRLGDDWVRIDPMNELRVLRVKQAPNSMANPWFENCPSQPQHVGWNARFSATERTYLYRVLFSWGSDMDWAAPFEWDRSWRVHSGKAVGPLDVSSMQLAASALNGQKDFSSFRSRGCQRHSPIVEMRDIQVRSQLLTGHDFLFIPHELKSFDAKGSQNFSSGRHAQLVNITFRGNSFLYRQVRNMTGCLVAVGRGQLSPHDIPALLDKRDRTQAPMMAPPQGLFLVDVKHGDFFI